MSLGGNAALLIADRDDDGESSPPPQALGTTTAPEAESTPAPAVTANERTEPEGPATTEPGEPAPAPDDDATGGAEAPADEQGAEEGPPRCSEIEVPERPQEAVTCRTPSAILTIVDEARPLLLGDTHVRVQSASVSGQRMTLRVRVRNETDAEQGIQAGGQELYLNLGGIRVDPEPVRDERLPPATGETISLRFALTPGRVRVLERLGGRAELGVRPWTAGGTATYVGVIRFSVAGG